MKSLKCLFATTVVVIAASACGVQTRATSFTASDASSRFTELLQQDASGVGDVLPFWRNLADMLPVVRFVKPDGSIVRATDVLVLGTVADVQPGSGFVVQPDGTDTAVAFDATAADGRWVNVTVDVEAQPCGETVRAGDRVTFRFIVENPSDLDAVRQALADTPRVLAFLKGGQIATGSEFFLAEPGAPFTPVSDSGDLPFPGLQGTYPAGFRAGIATLAELRAVCATVDRRQPAPGYRPARPSRS